MEKTFLYWSGGKDAAMAFHIFSKQYGYSPHLLVCTITHTQKVAAHEVDKQIIEAQAKALDIPILFIETPAFASNETYESILLKQLSLLKTQGYTTAICGDIFLEDIKQYRLQLHKKAGINCTFPLWGTPTNILSCEIINTSIKASIAAINTQFLDTDFLKGDYTIDFLERLPTNVDACGENGEFHTLVYNAPFFNHPLQLHKGKPEFTTYNKGTTYETELAFNMFSVE